MRVELASERRAYCEELDIVRVRVRVRSWIFIGFRV
jgi:hypothetical protein